MSTSRPAKQCRFFQQGHCKFTADACKWRHDPPPLSNTTQTNITILSPQVSERKPTSQQTPSRRRTLSSSEACVPKLLPKRQTNTVQRPTSASSPFVHNAVDGRIVERVSQEASPDNDEVSYFHFRYTFNFNISTVFLLT